MDELLFENCIGFDWDAGNQTKNQEKHGILPQECEQVFFNVPLLLYEDRKHAQAEKRMYVLGKTDGGRELFIVFTVRNQLLRVISARHMSKKERAIYEQVKKDPIV